MRLLNSPSIKTDIWDWQFDSPYFTTQIRPIVATDHWNNIVGFNGMMPVKLHLRDRGESEAAWSCDFFVSGETRGQGVGKSIKTRLKEQSAITFTLGTSAIAAKVLVASGWMPFNRVHSYQLPPQNTDQQQTGGLSIQKTLPPKTEVDALWEQTKPDLNAAVIRDYRYLKWRFEDAPLAEYGFIPCYKEGRLVSLAVVYVGLSFVSLVDYIGPARESEFRRAVIDTLLTFSKPIRTTTSCPEWGRVLESYHFSRSSKPINCFIYADNPSVQQQIADDFFLMFGDADGEILQSSIDSAKQNDQRIASQFVVETLSPAQFEVMEAEWEELLRSSDNANLFTSWRWMHQWWKTFAKPYRFELFLLSCRKGEKVVGLAPLYLRRYKRFGREVRQLQILGCSWGGPKTFRSEYLDFIVDRAFQRSARVLLLEYIFSRQEWDELVLGDIPHESLTTRLIEEIYSSRGVYARLAHSDFSVIIPTDLEKRDYLKRLSSNTRRSAFNMFAQLQKMYNCSAKNYTDPQQFNFSVINVLNKLHIPRWGRPCFQGLTRQFHEAIIKEFSSGNQLLVSTIEDPNNRQISLAYNLIYDDRVYNIQLGFRSSQRLSRYSLGLIQLGQSILYAISQDNIRQFDLLAGFGKQEYYKSRFGGEHYHLQTMQYLRTRWLVLLYKLYDYRNLGLFRKLRFFR